MKHAKKNVKPYVYSSFSRCLMLYKINWIAHLGLILHLNSFVIIISLKKLITAYSNELFLDE